MVSLFPVLRKGERAHAPPTTMHELAKAIIDAVLLQDASSKQGATTTAELQPLLDQALATQPSPHSAERIACDIWNYLDKLAESAGDDDGERQRRGQLRLVAYRLFEQVYLSGGDGETPAAPHRQQLLRLTVACVGALLIAGLFVDMQVLMSKADECLASPSTGNFAAAQRVLLDAYKCMALAAGCQHLPIATNTTIKQHMLMMRQHWRDDQVDSDTVHELATVFEQCFGRVAAKSPKAATELCTALLEVAELKPVAFDVFGPQLVGHLAKLLVQEGGQVQTARELIDRYLSVWQSVPLCAYSLAYGHGKKFHRQCFTRSWHALCEHKTDTNMRAFVQVVETMMQHVPEYVRGQMSEQVGFIGKLSAWLTDRVAQVLLLRKDRHPPTGDELNRWLSAMDQRHRKDFLMSMIRHTAEYADRHHQLENMRAVISQIDHFRVREYLVFVHRVYAAVLIDAEQCELAVDALKTCMNASTAAGDEARVLVLSRLVVCYAKLRMPEELKHAVGEFLNTCSFKKQHRRELPYVLAQLLNARQERELFRVLAHCVENMEQCVDGERVSPCLLMRQYLGLMIAGTVQEVANMTTEQKVAVFEKAYQVWLAMYQKGGNETLSSTAAAELEWLWRFTWNQVFDGATADPPVRLRLFELCDRMVSHLPNSNYLRAQICVFIVASLFENGGSGKNTNELMLTCTRHLDRCQEYLSGVPSKEKDHIAVALERIKWEYALRNGHWSQLCDGLERVFQADNSEAVAMYAASRVLSCGGDCPRDITIACLTRCINQLITSQSADIRNLCVLYRSLLTMVPAEQRLPVMIDAAQRMQLYPPEEKEWFRVYAYNNSLDPLNYKVNSEWVAMTNKVGQPRGARPAAIH